MKTSLSKICFLCFVFFLFKDINAQERLIILNEGLWQADNGKISYFEDGNILSNEWFRENNGYKLGDTPNDIIQINDDLIAISVNWSNIVQFITPQGKAVAATEDVPNNRKLATDGKYVYVTSYGHEVAINGKFVEFTKGYVAKIDINTFQVESAVEVGYEPEGIAYYNGYLFVANTGGYAFQENHDYETTVSVINADTMELVRNIDTKQINLYGKMSQSGKYLCINSPGDYYDVQAATIILDCECALEDKDDNDCFYHLEYAATYNTVDSDGNFYAIGSRYSYYTGEYDFNYVIINPHELFESEGAGGIYEDFPGTVLQDIQQMMMPYGIYINPYTGFIYATDAASFTSAGKLYQWSPDGRLLGTNKVYINPAHFLALPPNGYFNDVSQPVVDEIDEFYPVCNLQGFPVTKFVPGNIYIQHGRKFIFK